MPKRSTPVLSMVLLLSAASARAQPRRIPSEQMAFGYTHIQSLVVSEPFSGGYFFSVEGNTQKGLGVVGEFSGTLTAKRPRFFGDPSAGTGAYLAGPKYSWRISRTRAFAQLLAGIGSSGESRYGDYRAVGIEPGAGVDFELGKHIGLRFGAGYRHLHGFRNATGATTSLGMVRVGLVVY